MTKAEYIKYFENLGRVELLKLCRAGGLTAHKIKTDRELALLLWNAFREKQTNTGN